MAGLQSGYRAEFPVGLLNPEKQAEEDALKKLAAQQKKQQRRMPVAPQRPATPMTDITPFLQAVKILAQGGKGVRGGAPLAVQPAGASGSLKNLVTGATTKRELFQGLKSLGFRLTNDQTPGVHTPTSRHYFDKKKTRDINFGPSGTSEVEQRKLARLFQLMQAHRPDWVGEMFFDPAGGLKEGSSIGAIGGHKTHMHLNLNRRRY